MTQEPSTLWGHLPAYYDDRDPNAGLRGIIATSPHLDVEGQLLTEDLVLETMKAFWGLGWR